MRDLSREWIAVGLNGNAEKIVPVIRMDGTGEVKKVIRGVSGVNRISIYHQDFSARTVKKIGTVLWPENLRQADLLLTYRPETKGGELQLSGSGKIWNYMVEEPLRRLPGNLSDSSRNTQRKTAGRHEMVDREKVRRLEEQEEKRIVWPDELAEELKKDIYGQDEAITRISELIAGSLRRKKPEVTVILLFGPTGVGKTETGRKLPEALTKLTHVTYGLQQIALNEFVGEHSVNRFFGAPPSYVGYKDPTIFEPIRKNPYQVYLLDEIEKATDRIWTGLMEAFSTGVVHLADNSPSIDLSHVIFVITSNLPINMKEYNAASSFRKKEICRDALSRACGHPEIAGKITNCLAYQPFSGDGLTDIILKFVTEELDNYDMTLNHMDEKLMVQLKKQHSNYGARGVRDAVREALLNATVYERNPERYKGRRVNLNGDVENIQIEMVSE